MDTYLHVFGDLIPTTPTIVSAGSSSEFSQDMQSDWEPTQTGPGDPFFDVDQYLNPTF